MPRSSLFVVMAVAGVLAGCGGKTKEAATPTSPTDPRGEVMNAFVIAAATADAGTMWELLSERSQKQAGTVAEFEKTTAPLLRRQLAPFARGSLPVQVSENLDGVFGLLSLSRGPHAYAVPFRHEGNVWRVELPGRLRIGQLRPPPGSRGKFLSQIAVETHGPGGASLALLYVDGVTLDAKAYADPNSATIYANFASPLEPGRHTAVAFASTGTNAAARAWTFYP